MNPTIFTGAGVAIITPFLPNGEVNYEAFGKIIDFQIAEQSDAIVVMGTTGEASTCDDAEHIEVIRYCVERVNHRVPVIAGVGSNNTEHGVVLSKKAMQAGADALLHVTPYYNKTSQRGLIIHFTAMANAVDLPIILYNVPSRTGMSIQAETYLELSKIPNIVGTKEASGDFSLAAKTAALCGEDFALYSGNDDQALPILSLGGKGIISVISNVLPKKVHDMCAAYFAGDTKTATKIQLELLPMSDALFCDINPIPVKEAMNQLGWEAGILRAPLIETTESNKKKIHDTLVLYGLLA